MTKLYIMCGLAFSDKSTLSRKISENKGYELIAFDKLWVETEKERSVPQGAEGWRLIRDLAQEKILTAVIRPVYRFKVADIVPAVNSCYRETVRLPPSLKLRRTRSKIAKLKLS